MRYFCFGKQVV